MDHYQPPKAKLEIDEKKQSLLALVNKALLFIEFLFIILPTAFLLIVFSIGVTTHFQSHSIQALFLLLAFLAFLAMLSLSLLIISFVFQSHWLASWWHNLPYLGVLCVIIGFISQQLAKKQQSGFNIDLTYIEMFTAGFVLFIPLAHYQLSQHFARASNESQP